ncbi:hypothetical protein [Streptomyces rimosus]|uniref:hypothetical protein n=1 Tax=Streptomyces rimosus TaxID=1927 RepID=UPI0037CDC971
MGGYLLLQGRNGLLQSAVLDLQDLDDAGQEVGRLPGVVASDDGGEVGFALLFAGGDGVGVEAGVGVRIDPRDLRPQGASWPPSEATR